MNLSIGLSLTRPSGPLGFNPASLFASGEVGAWYDPSDLTTVWQDAAGTTPATAGDPVGRIDDKSGNGNHATQSTPTARPTLQSAGGLYYLDFDGMDDHLNTPATAFNHDPFTAAAAAKADTLTGNQRVLDNRGQGASGTAIGWHIKLDASIDNMTVDDGSGGYIRTAPLNTTAAQVLFLSWDQSSMVSEANRSAISVDGSSTPVGAIDTTVTTGTIGISRSAAQQMLDGRLYGAVVVDRAVNSAEKANLESYLATKSGVTL